MEIEKAEKIIRRIFAKRPFVMYMHGCRKTNQDKAIENVFEHKQQFNIGRNNIYSTFANCGTAKTDFMTRMKEYSYCGGDYNIIMAMPDAINIEQYVGCIKGQQESTQGYTNPVKVDYCAFATNKYFENTSEKKLELKHLNNKLILGYINNKTNEFVFNKDCIMFESDAHFENDTKRISAIAEKYYLIDALFYLWIKTGEAVDLQTLLPYCKELYDISEEKEFYNDVENSKFCNSVNFKSVLYSVYDTITNMKKNKEIIKEK